MSCRNVIILKDTFTGDYNLLKPYIDFFGFAYEETDKVSDCAVIIAGDSVLDDAEVMAAVKAGAGLVCFAGGGDVCATEIKVNAGHYVSGLHADGHTRNLYMPMLLVGGKKLSGDVIATAGEAVLLETGECGAGKIAYWHGMRQLSDEVLGPINGIDDLLWRSIVWAAKKPFVMQGMPPMVGLRVDDVWGAWREWNPENPLLWVEIANKYGIKPWLGIFNDDMTDEIAKIASKYVAEGGATAFPHALSGCPWVCDERAERCTYLEHFVGPYSDEAMKENATRTKAWFDKHNIPIAKYACAHYYETGANAIPYLEEWGCEFISLHMDFDVAYRKATNWIHCGPYRKDHDGLPTGQKPVYYGGYVADGKFFNCTIEIRDVCGYEWAPTVRVAETVDNGVTELRRCFDSMCPGILLTHESAWIQRITPSRWESILEGVTEGVAGYEPMYLTVDEICKYARAKHDITFKNLSCDGDLLELTVTGTNDMPTKCFLFTEENGEIKQKLADVPQITDGAEIKL